MFEIIALGFFFILAWRIPFVFDYLVLTPFLGTGLGMFLWSLAGLYGIDVYHWRTIAVYITCGIICTGLIVAVCTRRS